MNTYTAIQDFSLPVLSHAVSIGDTLAKYSNSVIVTMDGNDYTNEALYSWVGSADSIPYITLTGSSDDPSSGTIVAGSASLTAATLYVDVVAAFGGVPSSITVSVSKPAGGSNVFATIRQASITATGFTVDFSTPIPASGYKLHYVASV